MLRKWSPSYEGVAIAAAVAGLIFMISVLVIVLRQYDLTESFNPEINSHIGTFVASIAGTLFALTNALLLFATLKTQRQGLRDTSDQHLALRQDQTYERLVDRTDRLEAGIAAYSVTWGTHTDVLLGSDSPFENYTGLAKTFEIWIQQCQKDAIETHLALASRIDPETYLRNQVEVLDLMLQLNALVHAVKTIDQSFIGKEYLDDRLTTILTRLALNKENIQVSARLLRKFVDRGDSIVHKQHYASDLLHLERKLRLIENLLPDTPHRKLTPFKQLEVVVSKARPLVMFECTTVPTIQIDGVHFVSMDKDWALRFDKGRLVVQIEALDSQGKQLNNMFKTFSFSHLLHRSKDAGKEFDTLGLWFEEGLYNLISGRVEDHRTWRIDIGFEGMDLIGDEEIKLKVSTNAKSITKGQAIRRFAVGG